MRSHRLNLWVYWIAITGLTLTIGSGAEADDLVSTKAAPAAPSVAAPLPQTVTAELGEVALAQPETVEPRDQVGLASWYGSAWQGRPTASGERFDTGKLTAAHRTLPLATKVKVTNLENGRSVEVKVNDRGPYIRGRVLDLSTRAAEVLGMQKEGLALVRIEVLPEQVASVAVN